jgi:uncharacterized alpha-E superfamily protein
VVRSALRAARLVRDRISMDTWRILAALDEELTSGGELGAQTNLGFMHDLLNRIVVRLAAFSGQVMESMTRGQAFRFLDMGRRLERAMSLVMLLRATMSEQSVREGPLLEAVLDLADSGMTYRRRYLATLQVAPVLDLLLTDDSNPRSVIYQVKALTEHLDYLPKLSEVRSDQERSALVVQYELELAQVERLAHVDGKGQRTELVELLQHLGVRIPALSDALTDRYLAHATVSRHLQQQIGLRTPGEPPRSGR